MLDEEKENPLKNGGSSIQYINCSKCFENKKRLKIQIILRKKIVR
jgi:hypothetical protein